MWHSVYKYLGCIANEHVKRRVMVGPWVKAGGRVLCTSSRRCRVSVGEVRCCRQVGPLEQVQMRAGLSWGLGVNIHARVHAWLCNINMR